VHLSEKEPEQKRAKLWSHITFNKRA
jgi:hypothetical protein